jgi:hypothetical protein
MGVGTTVFMYHLYRAFVGRKKVCDKDKRSAHSERGCDGTVSMLHNVGQWWHRHRTRPHSPRARRCTVPGRVRGGSRGRVRRTSWDIDSQHIGEWWGFEESSGRTVMVVLENASVYMVGDSWDEWVMEFWYTEPENR